MITCKDCNETKNLSWSIKDNVFRCQIHKQQARHGVDHV